MSGPLHSSPLLRHGDSPSSYASSFVSQVGCDEAAETEEILQCLQVFEAHFVLLKHI